MIETYILAKLVFPRNTGGGQESGSPKYMTVNDKGKYLDKMGEDEGA